MDRSIMVDCPYCGRGNMVTVSDDYAQKQVVTCDLEDGGCDHDFVAAIRVNITARALAIEGEAPNE